MLFCVPIFLRTTKQNKIVYGFIFFGYFAILTLIYLKDRGLTYYVPQRYVMIEIYMLIPLISAFLLQQSKKLCITVLFIYVAFGIYSTGF